MLDFRGRLERRSAAMSTRDLVETLSSPVRQGLTKDQTFALGLDPAVPFSSDEEFMRLAVALAQCRVTLRSTQEEQTTQSLTVGQVQEQNGFVGGPEWLTRRVNHGEFQRVVQSLKAVRSKLLELRKSKLDRGAEVNPGTDTFSVPRITRYARKVDMDEAQTLLFEYIVAAQLGDVRSTGVGLYGADHLSVKGAAVIHGTTLNAMFTFLSSDRRYIKDGLFGYLHSMSGGEINLGDNLSMRTDTLRVFNGANLTVDEFLKIDGTALGEVLAEEPGSPHSSKDHLGDSHDPVVEGDAVLVSRDEIEVPLEGHEEASQPQELLADGRVEMELHEIIAMEREREKQLKELMAKTPPEDAKEAAEESDDVLKSYTTDLGYLTDMMEAVVLRASVAEMKENQELNMERGYRDEVTSQLIREKESKLRARVRKNEKRLQLTVKEGRWMPRLERMVKSRGLDGFQKDVLIALVAAVMIPNKMTRRLYSVRDLLTLFHKDMAEQIQHRKYFYKSSVLVKDGMITVNSTGFEADAGQSTVTIDRRMLDYLLGLDTEMSEVVDGSHMYMPAVQLEDVILPTQQKELVVSTVQNFKLFSKVRKQVGLDDVLTYGAGLVILLYGKSGTGKTLLANAIASSLQKKILLINFPSLGQMNADQNFKYIFRESKIHDALLFFDECESIFQSRNTAPSSGVQQLLTEIERHDGIMILSTNRPFDLDEAMHRRITISIEVPEPDLISREHIWKRHLPSTIPKSGEIDLQDLARRFELTGGFIKNAVLSALSIAVSRDGMDAALKQEDLVQGAKLQLSGRLQMQEFDRRVVPTSGLDELVVADDVKAALQEICDFEKAHSVLFGQWGFGKKSGGEAQGVGVLFYGPPGCGKTMASKAIGYEIGRPLKVVNCAELLSKWVGESGKNIEAVFKEARSVDAVLVFDEAEALFGTRTTVSQTAADRYANHDVGLLLYHIEHYRGIVVLTTNLLEYIDPAFLRRLRFVIKFPAPTERLRQTLWKSMLPPEAPVAHDVNFSALARDYELSGGEIYTAMMRAAARAALRLGPVGTLKPGTNTEKDSRQITMQDLVKSAAEEVKKREDRGLDTGANKSLYS